MCDTRDRGLCRTLQKQPPEVLYNRAVFKYFAIFTEEHLCLSFFFIKLKAFMAVSRVAASQPYETFRTFSNNNQQRLNLTKFAKRSVIDVKIGS